MKIRMILMMAFAVIATSTFAQQRNKGNFDPVKKAEKQTEKMSESLNLNDDQVVQIKEINLKHNSEMKALFEVEKEQRNANRKKMRSVHEARNAEFQQVLTPEQFATWETNRKEKRENKKGHHGKKLRGDSPALENE